MLYHRVASQGICREADIDPTDLLGNAPNDALGRTKTTDIVLYDVGWITKKRTKKIESKTNRAQGHSFFMVFVITY